MRVRSRSTERRGDVVSTPAGSPERKTASASVKSAFQVHFAAAAEDTAGIDLKALLDEVDRTAAELKRWRGRSQLAAYRRAVQSFVRAAVQRMYRVNQDTRFDRRGVRISSVTVQLIDERLEALTAAVVHGDDSAIPLAARLDEIRGLLLDLYG